MLGSTAPRNGKEASRAGFYEVVGSTPFANDYQLEFAKELVLVRKTGRRTGDRPAGDQPLGQRYSWPSGRARLSADAQHGARTRPALAEFFGFLGHQIGMANVWMALSADHGVAPLPEFAKTLRLPAANLDAKALREQINSLLSKKYAKKATTYVDLDYPLAWLNEEAFAASHKESDAESRRR